MTPLSMAMLAASTLAFIAAASAAKSWTLNSTHWWLLATLALYTIGNLVMLRLIRDIGMAVALSLSAVVQIAAVNLVALVVFGERVSPTQGAGLVLAIASVALISWPAGR